MDAGYHDKVRHALKAFMQARGLKVLPWCAKAGLSESTLRSFLTPTAERPNPTITLATLAALAAAADASIGELIGETTPAADPDEARTLAACLQALPDELRRKLVTGDAGVVDARIIETAARYVLQKNRILKQSRSVTDLAETIASLAMTEHTEDFAEWEALTANRAEAIVLYAPHRGSDDG